MRRWLPWLALGVLLAVVLAVGAGGRRGPPSAAQRSNRIAEHIRCPTCRSLSVAESDAAAAGFIRRDIARRVRAGQSDAEIRAYYVDRYGPDILLNPEARGVAALVWALPVMAFVVAGAGLAVAFRRWRPRAGEEPSAEDRALVEDALGT